MEVIIRFDGPEGAGKTVLSNHIAKLLRAGGLRVMHGERFVIADTDTLTVTTIPEALARVATADIGPAPIPGSHPFLKRKR